MHPVFYNPQAALMENSLPEEESWHAIKVLRLKRGDPIVIVDGNGLFLEAEITAITGKICFYDVLKQGQSNRNRSGRIHLAIAPTKQIERFELFIEKATEIGIDEITPVISSNSERKQVRVDRLAKVLIAAMKQSLKATLPILNNPVPFQQLLHQTSLGTKAIAHCREGEKIRFYSLCERNKEITLLIGPEGDFTQTEISEAVSAGFTPVSLGHSRLRTETAGIVAVHSFNLATGQE